MDIEDRPPVSDSPLPTYAPAAMAMGIFMFLWGFLTYWLMSVVGAGLMAWSLWTWVHEIRSGWNAPNNESEVHSEHPG